MLPAKAHNLGRESDMRASAGESDARRGRWEGVWLREGPQTAYRGGEV